MVNYSEVQVVSRQSFKIWSMEKKHNKEILSCIKNKGKSLLIPLRYKSNWYLKASF